MKIIQERVVIEKNKSFRLFKPSLRNYFFWHFHPEFELVYVEASTGIRHVGQHISSYTGSDLVMIGSNIPHLNFDYGLRTAYKQIVVQLKENFLGDALIHTPEFASIQQLFNKAVYGLSFSGKTKEMVAEKLKHMQQLDHFNQLICLMQIFQILSKSKEATVLNDRDTSIKLFLNDKIRMGAVYKYIDEHFAHKPDVNHIASQVHLTTAAFCRYFKRQTKMTFTDFVNQYRINLAKTFLLQHKTVSETCYAVGFESLSYFNKLFRKTTGINPSDFKKQYANPQ
jgi:AraC-like DNA-binding protein